MDTARMGHNRDEVYRVHREWNRAKFAPDGRWIGPPARGAARNAREWLFHAFAFLAGDADDVALGNAIVAATPDVNNNFSSIAAAHLMLHYGDRLEPSSRRHLVQIINSGLPQAIDRSLTAVGVGNFSSMNAFLFLAASQFLDTYDVPYDHKAIPEAYNRFRLRQFGVNLLQLLEDQLARTDLTREFNSPTYSPLSLLAMAEIVNFVDHPPAAAAAARIERRVWQELLAFHHPLLGQVSGPYSRGKTADVVGHASGWKKVCCFVGIDQDVSVPELVYPPQEGQVLHHRGSLAFQHCLTCWLVRPDYHVPADLYAAFRARTFPYTYEGTYEYGGRGFKRSDGKVLLSVQGDYTGPDGTGSARCYQDADVCVGSMSDTYTPENRGCHVVYRLDDGACGLGRTRSATLVMLTSVWPEYVEDPDGGRGHPSTLHNNGAFRLTQDGHVVRGTVEPYHWAPHLSDGCDEISLNLLVSEHLPLDRPVQRVCLNGEEFAGGQIVRQTDAGAFVIEDGTVRIVYEVATQQPFQFSIDRYGGFLRCRVLFYEGPTRMFTPDDLNPFSAELSLAVSVGPCAVR